MEEYYTSDMSEATYLFVMGYELLGVEAIAEKRTRWVFESSAKTGALRFRDTEEGQLCHRIMKRYQLMRRQAISARSAQ
jgi:hypothetical protein